MANASSGGGAGGASAGGTGTASKAGASSGSDAKTSGGSAGDQAAPPQRAKEVEIFGADGKSLGTFGADAKPVEPNVTLTSEDEKKPGRKKGKPKSEPQADKEQTSEEPKRAPRAKKPNRKEGDDLFNGVEAQAQAQALKDSQTAAFDQEVLRRVEELRRHRAKQSAPGASQVREDEAPEARPAPAKDAMPPDIESRYVKVAAKGAAKYYHAERPDALAFVDKGERLETKSDSERTAGALIAIAEARGWESVKVSGSQAFRREVWMEAMSRGMLVSGYKATDVDRAMLEHRIASGRNNAVERNDGPSQARAQEPSEPARGPVSMSQGQKIAPAGDLGPSRASPDQSDTAGSGRKGSRPLEGIVLEHGAARYNFDPDEKHNYYVKVLDDQRKERIVWGIKLADAIEKAGARPGDRISLQRGDAEAVTVEANVRDALGKVVGQQAMGAHRNEWVVSLSEESKRARREQAAEDFRNLPLKEAAKRHPEQLAAAGVLAAATVVAREKFDDEKARSQFLGEARERVAAEVAAGRELPEMQVNRTPKKEREAPRRQATAEPEVERSPERSR